MVSFIELGVSYQTAKKYADRLIRLGVFANFVNVKSRDTGKTVFVFKKDIFKELLGIKKKQYKIPKEIIDEIKK